MGLAIPTIGKRGSLSRAEAGQGAALRVPIHQKDSVLGDREDGGKICDGGFSYPAFLAQAQNANDHFVAFPYCNLSCLRFYAF